MVMSGCCGPFLVHLLSSLAGTRCLFLDMVKLSDIPYIPPETRVSGRHGLCRATKCLVRLCQIKVISHNTRPTFYVMSYSITWALSTIRRSYVCTYVVLQTHDIRGRQEPKSREHALPPSVCTPPTRSPRVAKLEHEGIFACQAKRGLSPWKES